MATPLLAPASRAAARETLRPAALARPWATSAVLLAADALALTVAGWLGYLLWSRVNHELSPDFFYQLWPALAFSLPVYACMGLYPAAGVSPAEELRRLTMGTTAVCLISTAAIFFSKDSELYSRGVLLVAWIAAVVLVPLGRASARRMFARRSWWGVPVLVLGAGSVAQALSAGLAAAPRCGLKPVPHPNEPSGLGGQLLGEEVLTDAVELARRFRVRQAILAAPGIGRQHLVEVFQRLATCFRKLIVVPDMPGVATLWVAPMDLSGVLGLEVRQNLLIPVNRWIKRTLDLAVASVLLVAATPLMALAAVWIKRVSPGPAFYAQEREGMGGRPIRVRKLRTMHLNSEALLLKHLRENPEARAEWQRRFKLKRDPRVVPVIGELLRRSSLDELPQLWSVLKGEMSLVGPRPFPYYHLEKFDPAFRALRTRVPPGLTGLWQVESRSDGDLGVQERLDTYYIRNWSVWLDLYILARTVHAVISGKGAF
jgi:Undecaprenyl-phosphate galactose phosphotransferase WbaP